MIRTRRWLRVSLVVSVLLVLPATGRSVRGGAPAMEARRAYWVFLRAPAVPTAPGAPALSLRALERLAKVGHQVGADPRDYALSAEVLAPLRERGLAVRRLSRWLQAASVLLTADQARELASDPRVRSVQPVAHFVRPIDPRELPQRDGAQTFAVPEGGDPATTDPRTLQGPDYANAWEQLDLLGVPELHHLGYSGLDVLVAIFDGGFYKNHASLSVLHLVAEHDFVRGDDDVQYEPGDPGDVPESNEHGTLTWSALGGFAPGRHMGAAYRASFALAKTEVVQEEVHTEEDNYIAALEWADSLGAAIVSSSLGYRFFDNGDGYSTAQLDGKTVPITVAAATAAERGIVIVTAMGNEGPGTSTLSAPADAERVVSVGAVNMLGTVAAFSSRGPTGDGRVKPDVCAMGVATHAAISDSRNAYGRASGTSLSTPLIAGFCALLLEARPSWGPDSVLAALHRSGDRSASPTNSAGWGIPDGIRALDVHGPRLRIPRYEWAEEGSGADGIPRWGEVGELRVWVRNDGDAASQPGSLWLVQHDSRLDLLDSLAVPLPQLAPGDSVVTGPSLARAEIAAGEGVDFLGVFVRLQAGDALFDRKIDLIILPEYTVEHFEAEINRVGTVHLSWGLEATGLTGLRLLRSEAEGEPIPVHEGILDPGTRTWIDHPGRPGRFNYLLELQFLQGQSVQAGQVQAEILEPTRQRIGSPFPNPAGRGSVSIPMAWPGSDAPRAKIYSVTGRFVCTIEGTAGASAFPTLVWDLKDDGGRRVASGLYVIRAPGGSSVRLVVVR